MSFQILIDVIGYFGGFILGIQLIPQIYKIYVSKSCEDISTVFLQLNILGLSLMTTYGVLTNAKPLYIPCSISLLSTIIVYSMTFIYTSPKAREITHTYREEGHLCSC